MSDSLVFMRWGGFQEAREKAWIEPFRKEVDFEVGTDSPKNYAKAQSMVESRQVVQDAADVGSDLEIRDTTNLLKPLDYSVIGRESILEGYSKDYGVAKGWKGSLSRRNLGERTEKERGVAA